MRVTILGVGEASDPNESKDKDTLFGGAGQDLFLFSVGLKKDAPDKVMSSRSLFNLQCARQMNRVVPAAVEAR